MTTLTPRPTDVLGLAPRPGTRLATMVTTGGVVLGAIAAVYAALQYRQAKEARLEQSRPYVLVTTEPGLAGNHYMDLVARHDDGPVRLRQGLPVFLIAHGGIEPHHSSTGALQSNR